jgi:hypothetical protein
MEKEKKNNIITKDRKEATRQGDPPAKASCYAATQPCIDATTMQPCSSCIDAAALSLNNPHDMTLRRDLKQG